MWRTRQRRDAATGKPYPWLVKDTAMVNHLLRFLGGVRSLAIGRSN